MATSDQVSLDIAAVQSGKATAYDSFENSMRNSVMHQRFPAQPNTSHGNRNRQMTNNTMIGGGKIGVGRPNSINFSQTLEFDRGMDFKKVQTANPGKRQPRRQIMAKNSNIGIKGGGGLIQNIEQGKFITIKDKQREDQKALELAQVSSMNPKDYMEFAVSTEEN